MLFKFVLNGYELWIFQVATNFFVSSLDACECNTLASNLDNASSV